MSLWGQAAALAARTPPARNRYVDFLRALSILFVISGHWLIATAYYHDGQLELGDMLKVAPWSQVLTWLFQVMPIFFIVGGYSNAVSLESARRRDMNYAAWLTGRLQRLVPPLFMLICAWGCLAGLLNAFGAEPAMAKLASQAALIPIWFLAIYISVVMLAPVTHKLWQRWGYASFGASIALAVLVDAAFFLTDYRWLGWSNYFWIWLGMHQLGYAWRDDRIAQPGLLLLGALLAFGALVALIVLGPYPVAMAGSPDAELSNTLPPKLPLVALGLTQFCLMLALEKPMQRWLEGATPWTATVLINGMIMTVYLWHMTIMIAVIGLAYWLGGVGLGYAPGSAAWWWTRPLWLGTLTAVLLPSALLLSAFERLPLPAQQRDYGTPRLIGGALLICLGVAITASVGFDGQFGLALDFVAFTLVLVGVVLTGLLPSPRQLLGGSKTG